MSGKGFLGALSKVFVEYNDDAPASPTAAPTPVVVSPTVSFSQHAPTLVVTAPDAALVASIDKSSHERLLAAVNEAGATYANELGDMLDTLKDSIPDERALYTSALKILAKKGCTMPQLLGDYDKCIGALEASNREFEATLKGQLDKRVGAKVALVADCDAKAKAKQEQIAQLNVELAELVNKGHEAQAGIASEQQKLDLTKSRFALAYQGVRGAVEAQRAKIAQYGERS